MIMVIMDGNFVRLLEHWIENYDLANVQKRSKVNIAAKPVFLEVGSIAR